MEIPHRQSQVGGTGGRVAVWVEDRLWTRTAWGLLTSYVTLVKAFLSVVPQVLMSLG